jgi:hypothetical protein
MSATRQSGGRLPAAADFGVRRNRDGDMFTCANCRKEKADSEQGTVGWLGNIGFLLVTKVPWWPSSVCRDCSRQVRLFGIVCILIVGVVVAVFVVLNR